MNTQRTPADNYHLDLMIAEANGLSVDLVDKIPLFIIEEIREYFLRRSKDG